MLLTIGILPCAGTASRIGRLPKFMFPMENNECLLSLWIKKLIELNCDRIIIPCSDVTYPFVRHITDNLNVDKINILNIGQTLTMNETIIKSISDLEYDLLIMGMPDTFITDINTILIERLITSDCSAGTYLWKLRKSQLGKIGQCRVDSNYVTEVVDKQINLDLHWGWGVLVWKKAFEKYIISTHQHPGYSLALSLEKGEKVIYEKSTGSYYDCGTLEGYKECITPKEPVYMLGMLIIFAVYTSRTDISDTVSKCLEQARKIYPEDNIIAVNNNSPSTTWKDSAIKNKIIIMDNTDELHRYEMGAYRQALKYYRADTYMFLQGSCYLNRPIDMSETQCDTSFAKTFYTFKGWYMNDQQLIFAKNLLNILPFLNYNRDDINGVSYNSFICNNTFVNDLFQYGLFDLPSNSKFHSWSFERILGLFIEYITKIPLTSIDGIIKCTETLTIDDDYNMVKIWFGQ